MKLILANKLGFCYGVKKAVEIAEKTVKRYAPPVYTLGPLIHNKYEVDRLLKLGIKPVDSIRKIVNSNALSRNSRPVLMRAHGLPKDLISYLKERKIKLIDCTCPIVKSVQKLVEKLSKEGNSIVIVGEKTHPEVIALLSYASTPIEVVNTTQDIEKLTLKKPIAVLSQTTQSERKFSELATELKRKYKRIKVFNTICNSVVNRQREASRIANKVQFMIIIGGKNSSNTIRLKEICTKYTNTIHIESVRDIKKSWFCNVDSVGIAAGASTPNWIINEVVDYLKNEF